MITVVKVVKANLENVNKFQIFFKLDTKKMKIKIKIIIKIENIYILLLLLL